VLVHQPITGPRRKRRAVFLERTRATRHRRMHEVGEDLAFEPRTTERLLHLQRVLAHRTRFEHGHELVARARHHGLPHTAPIASPKAARFRAIAKSASRLCPASTIARARLGSLSTRAAAAATMAGADDDSRTPASPSVSGTAVARNATIGTPGCIASSNGTQNPSC